MSTNKKYEPFFSLVVPVYNVEKYLKQCVDSILGQSFDDFELILINDGSKDSSGKICDDYSKKDKRVFVIHQSNGGQVRARKAGLKKSVGKYIFFIDSDDWLEPETLGTIYKEIKNNDVDIVTFNAHFCYSNDRKLPVFQSIKPGYYDKNQLKKELYPKMIYSGRFFYFGIYAAMWNKVFKRSLVYPNMISVDPKLKIGEDGVTTFASFLDAKTVSVLNERLYNYRDNNTSITRSYCVEQFDNAKLLIKTLNDINSKKAIYDLEEQIDYYYLYNIYSIFIEEFYYKYKKKLANRIKYLKAILDDSSVQETIKKLKYSNLPGTYRQFFNLCVKKKFSILIILTIFIAYKKRLRIFVKKVLKKY